MLDPVYYLYAMGWLVSVFGAIHFLGKINSKPQGVWQHLLVMVLAPAWLGVAIVLSIGIKPKRDLK